MVGGLGVAFDNLYVAVGINRGAKDYLLEQVGRHQPRTRIGRQNPTRAQQAQRQQVDVFVAVRGARLAIANGRIWAGRG